jgi:hypothetical protein
LVSPAVGADTSSAYCWPSGYFAKTEQHLQVQPDGSVVITGGRTAHLTTLEALEAVPAMPSEKEPPLYNEVSLQMAEGVGGLAAVFVRTDGDEGATLFAMGVRAMIQHLHPSLPPLPLLRHTPKGGFAIVDRLEQLRILRTAREGAEAAALHGTSPFNNTLSAAQQQPSSQQQDCTPRLPVDAAAYPELGVSERLGLHATYGIGRSSLHEAFSAIAHDAGGALLAQSVAASLVAAATVDNVPSAREIVRTAAPLLLAPLLVHSHGVNAEAIYTDLSTGFSESVTAEAIYTAAAERPDGANAASSALTQSESVRASVVTLKRACTAERSGGMLVALGAQITLSDFVAGATGARLRGACHWLADWCERAQPGVCSPPSFVFLLTSWLEARKVDGCVASPHLTPR